MEKYRLISENPSDVTKIKWYIQRKKFWGWRNIESKNHTKKEVRDWIQYEVDLLNREDEIRRGEII